MENEQIYLFNPINARIVLYVYTYFEEKKKVTLIGLIRSCLYGTKGTNNQINIFVHLTDV